MLRCQLIRLFGRSIEIGVRYNVITNSVKLTTTKLVTLTNSIHCRAYSRKPSRKQKRVPLTFAMPDYISVNKLSNLMNTRAESLIRELKKLGFSNVTHDYILTREYIELILQEFNYSIPDKTKLLTLSNVYDELRDPLNPKALERRPPIITIMGHVDHGKTTILDYLRSSSIVEQEHGGITQHIGAFQFSTPVSNRKITVLDTPGHAAFLKMRERGANITDIIVLVVAIDDSIMPQTIEAIKHTKNSGNQLLVAITKIDKITDQLQREKAIEKVCYDLLKHDIEIEKFGGDVQVVPISAKTGENMELFEESIVLLSDIMDLKAENSPKTKVEGWIIESEVNKNLGNVATALIKKGSLKKGAILISGNTYCKVKNIFGSTANKPLEIAGPSAAVKLLGWKDYPDVGEELIEVRNESIAKKYIAKRINLQATQKNTLAVEKINEQRALLAKKRKEAKLEGEGGSVGGRITESADNEGDIPSIRNVNFIVKSDVSGSAEAVKESLEPLGNKEVQCNIISSTVGIPTEGDLKMAQTTGSEILCFNLSSLPSDIVNNKLGVKVKQFNVIYKLIEEVTNVLVDHMEPIYEMKINATIEVKTVFNYSIKKKIVKVAGCRVLNGSIKRGSNVQILRGPDDTIIYDGFVASLKHKKESVAEVTKGHECGLTFQGAFEDFEQNDKIIVYENIKIPRHL